MESAPIHFPGLNVKKIIRRVPKNSASQGSKYFPSSRNAADAPRTRPGGVYLERPLIRLDKDDMSIILAKGGRRR
jgi:hypothetical protein